MHAGMLKKMRKRKGMMNVSWAKGQRAGAMRGPEIRNGLNRRDE
jgi:hypothetical protein